MSKDSRIYWHLRQINQVGRSSALSLKNSGIECVEEVAEADPFELSEQTGIYVPRCATIIHEAKQLIANSENYSELEPESSEM